MCVEAGPLIPVVQGMVTSHNRYIKPLLSILICRNIDDNRTCHAVFYRYNSLVISLYRYISFDYNHPILQYRGISIILHSRMGNRYRSSIGCRPVIDIDSKLILVELYWYRSGIGQICRYRYSVRRCGGFGAVPGICFDQMSNRPEVPGTR